MAEKNYAGKTIQVTADGYLVNMSDWTLDVANELAAEAGIELTDKHIEVLNFLREKQASGETLTIRKVGKSGIVDIKGLYQLFPGGPLKISSRLAGIPKPSSCV
ncbi:TusE/DsrC/DsvC family sulfur relay protein [Sunxiuqinia sp. A32]|uniref:TusE/DsrC/DsvC family sulfur relay protein n=1 Tax=Sunxiuqinia sp. A32 TaxID=3461496 RepID=UPI00404664EA